MSLGRGSHTVGLLQNHHFSKVTNARKLMFCCLCVVLLFGCETRQRIHEHVILERIDKPVMSSDEIREIQLELSSYQLDGCKIALLPDDFDGFKVVLFHLGSCDIGDAMEFANQVIKKHRDFGGEQSEKVNRK